MNQNAELDRIEEIYINGTITLQKLRQKQQEITNQVDTMKQVWKCDYCTDTSESEEIISEHEKNCYFNPDVKDCGTCERHIQMPYECDWTCELGWVFREERQTPCVKWVLAEGK